MSPERIILQYTIIDSLIMTILNYYEVNYHILSTQVNMWFIQKAF